MTDVKICGVMTPETISTAARLGARYVGLVFVPASPRFVPTEQAVLLAHHVPTGVQRVGLFVNADDATLTHIIERVPLDMVQLHGTETPTRVMEIKARFGLPVIKAVALAHKNDLETLALYEQVCDWVLCDAKAPAHSKIDGGNGVAFDWRILEGRVFTKPWMLAGGLTPDTVTDALSFLTPSAVDVSSGVESTVGVKDPAKIAAFIAAVRARG